MNDTERADLAAAIAKHLPGLPAGAVEHLVGHSLGIAGVYTDPEALGLREAVGMVPAVGTGNVEPLRRRGEAAR